MDNIEQNIREIASRYKWAINEKNLPKIANAKRRFFGEEDWSRCPCYPPEDNTHSCGSAACCQQELAYYRSKPGIGVRYFMEKSQ